MTKSKLKTTARPTEFPEWASSLVTSDANKEYNKYKPPKAKRKIGWEYMEVPPRQWVNYQADLICKWLEYIDSNLNKASIYKAKKYLPKAKDYKGSFAYIEDIKALAFSNGTTWQKIKTEEL
jgi:hypothetical protein